MSEQALWRTVCRKLGGYGHIVRVENKVEAGTPDVSYCFTGFGEGWIELKHAASWPRRSNVPLRLPHFTSEQRAWLLQRWTAGGNAWLLLQVGTWYLLFDGKTAAYQVGRATQEELYQLAKWHGRRGWAAVDLIKALRR